MSYAGVLASLHKVSASPGGIGRANGGCVVGVLIGFWLTGKPRKPGDINALRDAQESTRVLKHRQVHARVRATALTHGAPARHQQHERRSAQRCGHDANWQLTAGYDEARKQITGYEQGATDAHGHR